MTEPERRCGTCKFYAGYPRTDGSHGRCNIGTSVLPASVVDVEWGSMCADQDGTDCQCWEAKE